MTKSKPKKLYSKNRLIRETNKIFREASARALVVEDDATKSAQIEGFRFLVVMALHQSRYAP